MGQVGIAAPDPRADSQRHRGMSQKCLPGGDISGHLFDQLVRRCEKLGVNVEAKRLGGGQIDHKVKLG